MNRFDNKVALITGAASGIGLATVERLASEGASILACDVNAAELEKQVQRIAAAGHDVVAHPLDVTDSDACAAAVEAVVARFGRLDILCNIAGIGHFQHFAEISRKDWDKIIAVNLTSVFVLTQLAMPHLLASQGNIVNVSSVAGLTGIPYNAAYCASKAGVSNITRALAAEFSSKGVRVNAVCPGGVNTPLSKAFSMPEGVDMQVMGRVFPLTPFNAEPQEIAGSIAYLASDEARFVTGTQLVIDGGQLSV